eukprot:g5379.t1
MPDSSSSPSSDSPSWRKQLISRAVSLSRMARTKLGVSSSNFEGLKKQLEEEFGVEKVSLCSDELDLKVKPFYLENASIPAPTVHPTLDDDGKFSSGKIDTLQSPEELSDPPEKLEDSLAHPSPPGDFNFSKEDISENHSPPGDFNFSKKDDSQAFSGKKKDKFQASSVTKSVFPQTILVEKEILRRFNRLDKDKNGYLDKQEIKYLALLMGQKLSSKKKSLQRGTNHSLISLNEAIKQMDPNNDGKVEIGEFIKWYHRTNPIEPHHFHERVRYLFNEIDTNGDGSLNEKELEILLSRTGNASKSKNFSAVYGKDSAAFKDAVSVMDPNGDGSVTLKEFMQWYCNANGIPTPEEVKVVPTRNVSLYPLKKEKDKNNKKPIRSRMAPSLTLAATTIQSHTRGYMLRLHQSKKKQLSCLPENLRNRVRNVSIDSSSGKINSQQFDKIIDAISSDLKDCGLPVEVLDLNFLFDRDKNQSIGIEELLSCIDRSIQASNLFDMVKSDKNKCSMIEVEAFVETHPNVFIGMEDLHGAFQELEEAHDWENIKAMKLDRQKFCEALRKRKVHFEDKEVEKRTSESSSRVLDMLQHAHVKSPRSLHSQSRTRRLKKRRKSASLNVNVMKGLLNWNKGRNMRRRKSLASKIMVSSFFEAEFSQAFEKGDKDSNGFLTIEEIQDLITTEAELLLKYNLNSDNLLDVLLRYDVDSTSKISKDAFMNCIHKEVQLLKLFEVIKKNGTVSCVELKIFVDKNPRVLFEMNHLSKLFEKLTDSPHWDQFKDERMNQKEFSEVLNQPDEVLLTSGPLLHEPNSPSGSPRSVGSIESNNLKKDLNSNESLKNRVRQVVGLVGATSYMMKNISKKHEMLKKIEAEKKEENREVKKDIEFPKIIVAPENFEEDKGEKKDHREEEENTSLPEASSSNTLSKENPLFEKDPLSHVNSPLPSEKKHFDFAATLKSFISLSTTGHRVRSMILKGKEDTIEAIQDSFKKHCNADEDKKLHSYQMEALYKTDAKTMKNLVDKSLERNRKTDDLTSPSFTLHPGMAFKDQLKLMKMRHPELNFHTKEEERIHRRVMHEQQRLKSLSEAKKYGTNRKYKKSKNNPVDDLKKRKEKQKHLLHTYRVHTEYETMRRVWGREVLPKTRKHNLDFAIVNPIFSEEEIDDFKLALQKLEANIKKCRQNALVEEQNLEARNSDRKYWIDQSLFGSSIAKNTFRKDFCGVVRAAVSPRHH